MMGDEIVIPHTVVEAVLTDLARARRRRTPAAEPRAVEALAIGQARLLDVSRDALWAVQGLTVAPDLTSPQWLLRALSDDSDLRALGSALLVLAHGSMPPPSGTG